MFKKSLTLLLFAAITAGAYMHVEYSNSQDATGCNAQQKLDRVPNTANCHAVWHSYYGPYPNGIYHAYWSYYLPPTPWVPQINIPTGLFTPSETASPSVVAVANQGSILFAYLVGDTVIHIKPPGLGSASVPEARVAFVAAAQVGNPKNIAYTGFGQDFQMWREPPVIDAASIEGWEHPIIAWVGLIEHDEDMVSATNCLILVAPFCVDVQADGSPSAILFPNYMALDHVDNTGLVNEFTNLSIDMDADFGTHFVWRRHDGDIGYGYLDPGYVNNLTNLGPYYHWAYLPSSAYPNARNPQLSVYGDSAYIVYQEAGDVQQINCASHLIGEPPEIWTDPERIDTRGDQYLRDQPYRRNKADIWQEDSIVSEIFDRTYRRWVSPIDQHAARYPNVNTQYIWQHTTLGDPPQYPPWIYALWTEETGVPNTPYDVRFDVYRNPTALMSSGASGTTPPVYLGIIGGEENQPYALRREGAWRLNDYALDYDPSELLYKVSFLAQPYLYLARIIVSVPADACIPGAATGTTAYTEEVSFDGTKVGVITFAPGMTDTLYALIPEDSYAEDRMIRLSIKGLAGAPALLKEFTVYRFETEPAEAQGSSDIEEAVKTLNLGLHAVPSEEGIGIEYSLNNPGSVSIQFFDVSGRKAAEFSEPGETGINSFVWDTPDASSGVYFIRLMTAEGSASTKALLLR